VTGIGYSGKDRFDTHNGGILQERTEMGHILHLFHIAQTQCIDAEYQNLTHRQLLIVFSTGRA
jgi:hypothetical protein